MPPPEGIYGLGRAYTGFRQLLAEAIADIAERGYVDAELIDAWMRRLRAAAERELASDEAIDAQMRAAMGAIYTRLIDKGRIVDYVPEVGRYTLSMIRPELRAELDRRILASADLIKLRRKDAIEKTLERFQGWSTSIPPGGGNLIEKREVRASVAKSMAQFKFEQRRVAIDQGHKLLANVSNIVAAGSGAIAAEWHSHWRQVNYNYRPDHKERDLRVYAIRGSWAIEQGLMTKGDGYTDEMTAPAQEPFCRCWFRYITSLRRLPNEMLTEKGRKWLAEAAARRGMAA